MGGFFVLEKFELLTGRCQRLFFAAIKKFHSSKLFIGNAEYAHMAFFGEQLFNTADMNLSIFLARAVTQVNRKLKHIKAIIEQTFTELRIDFALLFGFGW